MRKILVISAFPPCDKTAGQSYTNRLIQDLCESNKVDLIYFSYPGHHFSFKHENLEVKKVIQISLFNKFLNSLKCLFLFPFFTSRFTFRVLWYVIVKKRDYDCLYFDFSQVLVYSLFVAHPYKVLMSHDVIIQKYHRQNLRFKSLILDFCLFTERLILKGKNNNSFVFSDKDRRILSSVFKVKSTTVDFYVDQNIYNLTEADFVFRNDFALFGAWNREENKEGLLWFIREVLIPMDESKDLNVSFIIIGNGLSDSLAESLKAFRNVKVLGYIDNPYPLIASSRCLIAPIFNGAGVKVKVLESAFCATYVLGTDLAMEGIDKRLSVKCVKFNGTLELVAQMKALREISYSASQKYNDHLEILKYYPKRKFSDYLKEHLDGSSIYK